MDRDEVIRKVLDVSQSIADGYRSQSISLEQRQQIDAQEWCACAASNTGYFILQSLGVSDAEIRALMPRVN